MTALHARTAPAPLPTAPVVADLDRLHTALREVWGALSTGRAALRDVLDEHPEFDALPAELLAAEARRG